MNLIDDNSVKVNIDNKNVKHHKPKAYLGLLVLIPLLAVLLFFMAYLYQTSSYYGTTNKYINEVKLYISEKSAFLIDKTNALRDRLMKRNSKDNNREISVAQIDASVELDYYKAMSLLNEGLDEEALKNLKVILAKYPNFEPAKNLYAVLNNVG